MTLLGSLTNVRVFSKVSSSCMVNSNTSQLCKGFVVVIEFLWKLTGQTCSLEFSQTPGGCRQFPQIVAATASPAPDLSSVSRSLCSVWDSLSATHVSVVLSLFLPSLRNFSPCYLFSDVEVIYHILSSVTAFCGGGTCLVAVTLLWVNIFNSIILLLVPQFI